MDVRRINKNETPSDFLSIQSRPNIVSLISNIKTWYIKY